MNSLTIRRPDDLHVHFRDGEMLKLVVPYTSEVCARAIVMPNLVPPVVTTADAEAYRARIMAAVPDGHEFRPLMTLYLTEQTDPADVVAGARAGAINAVKLYPAGATTNSASGVRNFENVLPVLEAMAEVGLPLCIHGEVTHDEVDIFDREARFIDDVLDPLRQRLPELKIISEHVTTSDLVEYIKQADRNLAGTITAHHLMINRNHILVGGIKPHYYCLPVAKREEHRQALLAAATSGDPRFFLGTDTAPHAVHAKENACGCAGVFTALNLMSYLATAFESVDALDKLEGFTSEFGAKYYGLPLTDAKITLERQMQPIEIAKTVEGYGQSVAVFDPLVQMHWKMRG